LRILTRRGFLKLGGAAALGFAFRPPPAEDNLPSQTPIGLGRVTRALQAYDQPYFSGKKLYLYGVVTPAPPSFLPALPTPALEQPRRMIIPAINVDAPVVQGVGWEQLKKGIGQVPGTTLPGQVSNSVYAAHNDIYGEIFRYLDRLKPGDEVRLYTASREFRYIVREWRIVEPIEVGVMDPTPTATLTLISCYPYLVDTQRIIVFAGLVTGTEGQ
jgi:LPXTG-site transpeptidase (sortase) family protein